MDGTPAPASPSRQSGPEAVRRAELPLIRVLVAEDVPVVRETLAALLGLEPDIQVAVAVESGEQIVPAALAHRPDVAVLDIGLPGTDGLTAAAELHERCPGCRVLILTGLETPGNLDAARHAEVAGFLLKDGPADKLVRAVRAVNRGERVIDSRLAGDASGPGERPAEALRSGLSPGMPQRGGVASGISATRSNLPSAR